MVDDLKPSRRFQVFISSGPDVTAERISKISAAFVASTDFREARAAVRAELRTVQISGEAGSGKTAAFLMAESWATDTLSVEAVAQQFDFAAELARTAVTNRASSIHDGLCIADLQSPRDHLPEFGCFTSTTNERQGCDNSQQIEDVLTALLRLFTWLIRLRLYRARSLVSLKDLLLMELWWFRYHGFGRPPQFSSRALATGLSEMTGRMCSRPVPA